MSLPLRSGTGFPCRPRLDHPPFSMFPVHPGSCSPMVLSARYCGLGAPPHARLGFAHRVGEGSCGDHRAESRFFSLPASCVWKSETLGTFLAVRIVMRRINSALNAENLTYPELDLSSALILNTLNLLS